MWKECESLCNSGACGQEKSAFFPHSAARTDVGPGAIAVAIFAERPLQALLGAVVQAGYPLPREQEREPQADLLHLCRGMIEALLLVVVIQEV